MSDLPLIIDDRETPKFWINRATMVEPEILQLEREKIFDRCWLYVGHESELPKNHDFRTRRVGGRPVIFNRGSDGQIRVLLNSCTHRGMMVESRPEGNGRFLKCFYHGWSFNAQGDLVAMPLENDYPEGWSREQRCLPRPPFVDSYRGFWFLCWDPQQPQSLREYLANATDFIDLVADQSPSLMQINSGTNRPSPRQPNDSLRTLRSSMRPTTKATGAPSTATSVSRRSPRRSQNSWLPLGSPVESIPDLIVDINRSGTSVLLVEQNAAMALSISNVGYVMETGRVVRDGPAAELREDKDIPEFYLGMGGDARRSFREIKSYRRRKRWSA